MLFDFGFNKTPPDERGEFFMRSSDEQSRRARCRWGHKNREQRFLEKVQKTSGCWWWTGAGSKKKGVIYGSAYGPKGFEGAHRCSWRFFCGNIPAGMLVLHRCDNKLCVRPSHLFLGTQLDNMRDMIAKGRGATGLKRCHHPQNGENNNAAKLNWKRVRRIRVLVGLGWSDKRIAKKYNVSHCTITCVRLGKTWRESGFSTDVPAVMSDFARN